MKYNNYSLMEQGVPLYRNILFLCFLFTFAGCSSSGEIKINQPLTGTIDHKEIVALSVAPADDMDSNDETVKKVILRLKGALFGRLVSEGVFRQVVHEGDEAKYILNVKVAGAREVSQGARIFFGVLAGANTLVVSVQLNDSATPRSPMVDLVATGESAAHPFSSENDMDDAIREVVDEIILALR